MQNALLRHALNIFEFKSIEAKTIRLGELIQFVKGKNPKYLKNRFVLPYISIKYLEGIEEPCYSSEGTKCNKTDILMVMDGASSGKVFIGEEGYIGSTLAKISVKAYSELIYLFLIRNQNSIRKNTTGSAIPHADKDYISKLNFPLIENSSFLKLIKYDISTLVNLRSQNKKLRKIKELLLSKYF